MWRRTWLVSFEVKFWKDSDREIEPGGNYPERFKVDPELTNRLAMVGAEGVLADMVEHAAAFYRTGGTLSPPAEVTRATAEYRADQDVIGQFFSARVREDHQGAATAPKNQRP
ncbi:unnamed protein product [Gemmata massiliana]|uniref:Uncharacterized protein n=1 Tax=Gemmata massiliana TaxID=1210884 RepID=A0A6P2D6G9_9BACT|nr:hypothetical protein [Gemmata massiliana]VTR95062.1 unnamed protein product [Gemmata massiliana]